MKSAMILPTISRLSGGLGPAVRDLSLALVKHQTEVAVLAGNDEYTQTDLLEWSTLDVCVHPMRGPRAIGYQRGLAATLEARSPDVLHLHGLWTYASVISARWSGSGRPVVISPHGMLDQWALQNSPWKKNVAKFFYENRNLRRAACLHALCDAEKGAMRAFGLTNPIAVIPNGVDTAIADAPIQMPDWRKSLPESARIMLFLGRIHPKKGLRELIRAVASTHTRTRSKSRPLHLVIAGWDQGGHEAELRQLTASLDLQSTVHFIGPQFGSDKQATFGHSDIFVLPSHSEGLPISVLEAWAFRLPALLTPHCNLPEGKASAAAIEASPDPSGLALGILELMAMDHEALRDMGNNGRNLVEASFAWPIVAAQMKDLYSWIGGAGPIPDFVDPKTR